MITHYPLTNAVISEFNRFFNHGGDFFPARGECSRLSKSEIETVENEESNGWKLRVPLPGFKKEEVKLSVDGDYLLVEAETSDEDRSFLSSTTRRFRITDEVDTDKVSARFEDGILYLEVPRRPETEPKLIDVK